MFEERSRDESSESIVAFDNSRPRERSYAPGVLVTFAVKSHRKQDSE